MQLFSDSKLVHHLANVKEWSSTGNAKPILLELDMTNWCDHKCPHCACAFARSFQQLTRNDADDLLFQAKDLGVRAVVLTGGGEPLLNSSTPHVIELSKKIGLDVGLITNGTIIDGEMARNIVSNSKWCRVSLDASNAAVYNLMHGVDTRTWERAIKGISALVEQKNVFRSNITIGIGYLVNKQNLPNLLQAAQLSNELGVDYLQIRPMRNSTLDVRDLVGELKESVGGKTQLLLSESRYSSMGKPRSYKQCHAVNFAITVGADYSVYACCETKYQLASNYGSLRKNTLKEIWEGEMRKTKVGIIYDFCPHPCRHNANNMFLEKFSSHGEHINFI